MRGLHRIGPIVVTFLLGALPFGFAAEWHRDGDGQWYLRRLLMQPAPPGGS